MKFQKLSQKSSFLPLPPKLPKGKRPKGLILSCLSSDPLAVSYTHLTLPTNREV